VRENVCESEIMRETESKREKGRRGEEGGGRER